MLFLLPIDNKLLLHKLYDFYLLVIWNILHNLIEPLSLLFVPGMHRKSLEAAEHLKESDNCNSNSDHEETNSIRTENSNNSTNSSKPNQPSTTFSNVTSSSEKDQQQQAPGQQAAPPPPQRQYPEDPEAFRNNSIACLRAKAQEHNAKLLNHGIMLQVTSARSNGGQQNCDANANNLHHQEIVKTETNNANGIFWQNPMNNW